MLFGYGSFRCEEGEARPTQWTESIVRGPRNTMQGVTRTLAVEFDIIKDGQAAINARLNQIYNAVNADGRDVGFYLNTGAPSAFFINSGTSQSGVLIDQRPLAQPSDAADYATHLRATAAFHAVYTPGQAFGWTNPDTILDYGETVTMVGTGGPRRVVVPTDTGTPLEFILCDSTPVVVQQSGYIVQNVPGVNANPYVAGSRYLEQESARLSPSVRWNSRSGHAEYSLQWDFTFILPAWSGYFNPILR